MKSKLRLTVHSVQLRTGSTDFRNLESFVSSFPELSVLLGH